MTTTTLTAKNFFEPLLRVLLSLTEAKANTPVNHADTYDPICSEMGITLDQFGVQENTKALWVEKWIQWAFRDVIEKGYGVRTGRGQWALTDGGLEAAQKLAPVVAPPAAPSSESGGGIVISKMPVAEDNYHPDSYIRALAINVTKCFGAFSTQSSLCGSCPLQGACINAMSVEFSAFSRQLAEEDRQSEIAAKMPPPTITPPAPAASSAPAKAQTKDFGPATKVIAQQSSICRHCGGQIPKGIEAYWVRSGDGKQAGMFHLDCLEVK